MQQLPLITLATNDLQQLRELLGRYEMPCLVNGNQLAEVGCVFWDGHLERECSRRIEIGNAVAVAV